MVAAALAGSLVTLLLEPARSAPSTAAVTFRNVGRITPAPARSAVAGSGQSGAAAPAPAPVYIVPAPPGQAYIVPAQPGQAYIVPAQPGQMYEVPAPEQAYREIHPAPGIAWLAGPPGQAMMPGCVVPVPSVVPPGSAVPPPIIRKLRHRHIIMGPGLHPKQIRISRLPLMKSFIGIPRHCVFRLAMVPPPIVKRFMAIPGRCAVPAQIGLPMVPKRIVMAKPGRRVQISINRLRTSWRVVLIGPRARRTVVIPGGVMAGNGPTQPGCMVLPVPPPAG